MYLDGLLYGMDPEWDAYNRYNWMSAQLAEWGGGLPVGEVDTIRAAAGWSSNDWAMLQRWSVVDPTLHSPTRVSDAYEAQTALVSRGGWGAWLTSRIAVVNQDTLWGLATASTQILVVLGALVGAYASALGAVAAAAGLLLFTGLCVAIEAVFKDLPFRLLAPLQTCVLAAVLLTLGRLRRTPSVAASIVALAAILMILTEQTRTIAATASLDRLHNAQVEQDVAELLRLSPSLIVTQADEFPSEVWWRPFVRPATALPAIWLDLDPPLQRFLSATERQPLFRAICEDPSIVVVSVDGRLELITQYLREHADMEVRWEEVFTGSFRAWRCVPQT